MGILYFHPSQTAITHCKLLPPDIAFKRNCFNVRGKELHVELYLTSSEQNLDELTVKEKGADFGFATAGRGKHGHLRRQEIRSDYAWISWLPIYQPIMHDRCTHVWQGSTSGKTKAVAYS